MYSILRVYILSGEWFVNCFQWFFIIGLISLCFFKITCFYILPSGGMALTASVANKIFCYFIGGWVPDLKLNELKAKNRMPR